MIRVAGGVTIILLAVIAAIAATPATAAPPSPLPSLPFKTTTWTTEQGLPGDTVRAIVQTRDGYLWVATQAGLARFDGIRFTVFSKPAIPEFRTNECNALLEGRDGSLWIGTIGGGLMRFRDGRFTTYGRAEGMPTDVVNGLYEDREGRIWITSYEAVTVFADGKFRSFGTADAERHVYAMPFYEDAAGKVWFFNTRGLNLNNAGSLLFYQNDEMHWTSSGGAEPAPHAPGTVNAFAGRNGAAWFNDRVNGTLTRFGGEVDTVWRLDYGNPGGSQAAVLLAHEDAAGDLWYQLGGGELRWARGPETYRIAVESLPAGAVNVLSADREGDLWLGSSAGLTRLTRLAFRSLTPADGLSNETAWAVFQDSRGDVWVGTNGGVDRIRGQEFATFRVADGMAANGAVSIAEDAEGRLWFASTLGLTGMLDGKFQRYGRAEGLLNENVRAVFVDSRNQLWVGSVGGLQLLANGVFTSYTTAQGLSHNNVLFVGEDRTGALWVGTPDGLNRMRDGRFEVFKTPNGLSSNIVVAMKDTGHGSIWFGTVGGGLVRYREGKFAAITSAQGLGDDTITAILDDDAGNFWLGSTRGVLRLNRAELDQCADGSRPMVNPVTYGKGDGMPSADCSGGTQPAGARTADGRLWFPTSKGIAVIDPHGLTRNTVPPPVVIEGLTVDREIKPVSEGIKLTPGSRAVEFHYTALSFKDPLKVRFRYKLEGFDPDWVDAGTRREAFYTNLRPGTYRFRVLAANDDGVWNEQGTSLSFTSQPYFYQTVWFYLICAMVLAATMWAVHLLRIRQLRREFNAVLQERNRIARDLHDTLAQGFTSVSMLLEAVSAKARNAPEAAAEHLNQARLLVRSSLAEARRAVRDLRSEMLADGNLGAALETIARQLTAGTNVHVEMKVSGTARRLPEGIERALLRVGQEAMTNAIRHGHPQSVQGGLEYHPDHVALEINDDGNGFDPATVIASTNANGDGGGFGLKGMHERLAAVGGALTIESRPGAGTELRAVIPIKDNSDG